MNFLILGSSGFIGKNLTSYLKSQNHNVFEFDIKVNRNQDLRLSRNRELLSQIESSDFVFFLAFDVGGAKYLEKCDKNFDFISNNLMILKNTFEIIKSCRKPFLFVSSYQVHKSDHSYAVTKKIGEHLALSVNGLVVRLYNVYGKEDYSPKSHVIPDMINQAITTNKITIQTNGKEKRQFLHVEDCCTGLYTIFLNYNSILKENQIIDLTSFKWVSIKSVGKLISKKLKAKLEITDQTANFAFMPEPNKLILKYWNPKICVDAGIDKILNDY